MKSKALLTVLSILLAMAFLVTGCAGNQAPAQKPAETQTQSTTAAVKETQAASEATDPDVAKGMPAKPLVDKPVTLSLFVQLDSKVAATKKSYSELPVFSILEEKTGIKIDFRHPPSGMEQEQFNLMVASGDLTDMIYWTWLTGYPGGPEKALSDRVIMPLNDVIAESAPNFSKWLQDHDKIRKEVSTDSGKFYLFPVCREVEWQRFFWGFQMRKDWLEKVGMRAPTTMDEWYTVLKAFKDQNVNGQGNVIPFGNITSKPNFSTLPLTFFMGAWGMTYGFYHENGTVKFGAAQPEYKEFLETMKKWYAEGLIDPDFASTDTSQFDAKVTSNRIGSYAGQLNGQMGKYLGLMKNDPSFDLVGVPFPKAKDGKNYNFWGESARAFTGAGIAISGTTQKAKEAAAWLNLGYTEWGHNLLNFGIEGVTYNWENGYPKYTDKIMKDPELPVVNALAQYTIASTGGRFFSQDDRYFEQALAYPSQKPACDTWAQSSVERTLPPISATPEESSQLASIMNEIYTYVDEMFVRFVLGEEDISTGFDAYIERLKQMGIEDAVRINQAALERYNKR